MYQRVQQGKAVMRILPWAPVPAHLLPRLQPHPGNCLGTAPLEPCRPSAAGGWTSPELGNAKAIVALSNPHTVWAVRAVTGVTQKQDPGHLGL